MTVFVSRVTAKKSDGVPGPRIGRRIIRMLKLVLTNISYGSMIIQSKGVLTGGECLFCVLACAVSARGWL